METTTAISAPTREFIDSCCERLHAQIEHLSYLAEQAGRMQVFETPEQYQARRAAIHQRINEVVAQVRQSTTFLYQLHAQRP